MSAEISGERNFGALFKLVETTFPFPYDINELSDLGITALRSSIIGKEDAFENCMAKQGSEQESKLPPRFARALECFDQDSLEPEARDAVFEKVATAMLAGLDSSSHFIPASTFAEMSSETQPAGIGLSAMANGNSIEVVKTTRDTPARSAGVKAGDIIVAIDGQTAVDLDATMKLLRGKMGSTVTLRLRTVGGEERDLVLKRQIITGAQFDLDFEILGTTLLIRLDGLSDRIATEINNLIVSDGSDAKQIVLDLRENEGGLLDQAIEVADLFLDKGEITTIRGKGQPNEIRHNARIGDIAKNRPIVVLTSARTASGAEIIASALQDNKRAIVLGQQSYAAGTVQSVFYVDRKSAIRLTSERIFRSDARALSDTPIIPDCKIPENAPDIIALAERLMTIGVTACPAPHP